jgi:predicted amidohydrolase YtcJ
VATADLLFRNGTVFDGHGFLPGDTCVLVRQGRVAAVGPADSLREGSQTVGSEPVDLGGGTLLPGFIDAHAHPVHAGEQLAHCDLRTASTSAGYVDLIAAYVRDHPDLAWITGGGWSMEAFPGGIPDRSVLDAVVSDRPVFLPNRDGHGAWVNSKALELAGINASTPDPADGRIDRGPDGEPVGGLQEGAMRLVSRLLPELTNEDWDRALLLAQDHLLSLGITGWQDAIVGRYAGLADPLGAYMRMAEAGKLLATVVGALWWDRDQGLEQLPELTHRRETGSAGNEGGGARDAAPAQRGGSFRATAVKMMLDGVAETHTAAMLEPYLDGHGCATAETGIDFIDPAELPRFVSELDRHGFQVHFHALGDRAVRNALDAVAAARNANPSSGLRHHLAHLQVIHPDDLARFAALGATANIQPLWATHEPQMDELTIPFLGERRTGWQYPFRSLADSGARLAAGSDWPVSSPDPLQGSHVAVNRAIPPAAGGHGGDPFLPEQALGLEAILAAYTSGSAWVNGLEHRVGAIRPGLDADFAITDADLAGVDAGEICEAVVTQTWIRGELTYQRR